MVDFEFFTSNCQFETNTDNLLVTLVEGLKPEMDIDVATDHSTFMGGVHELEEYLMNVLGLTTSQGMTNSVPEANSVDKARFDGKKLKRILDNLYEPMFDHVYISLVSQLELLPLSLSYLFHLYYAYIRSAAYVDR